MNVYCKISNSGYVIVIYCISLQVVLELFCTGHYHGSFTVTAMRYGCFLYYFGVFLHIIFTLAFVPICVGVLYNLYCFEYMYVWSLFFSLSAFQASVMPKLP